MSKANNIYILFFILFLVYGCKGSKKSVVDASNNFENNIENLLASKMASYNSQSEFSFESEGFYRVENLSVEKAPYLVGQIISIKDGRMSLEQLPNMLNDIKNVDSKIRFDSPEISMFLNKESTINLSILDRLKSNLTDSEKLKIVYDKSFVATPNGGWFNYKLWEESIVKYTLSKADSLKVINHAEVRKFSYSTYNKIDGNFSLKPAPVVAIDGAAFQESISEQNIYELYIGFSNLRFPHEAQLAVQNLTEEPARLISIPEELDEDELEYKRLILEEIEKQLKNEGYLDDISAQQNSILIYEEENN